MPSAYVLLQLCFVSKLTPAIYITNFLLFIGQAYFYSGMLFNKIFIKLRDYCADYISTFLDSINIALSHREPKLTKQPSISAS